MKEFPPVMIWNRHEIANQNHPGEITHGVSVRDLMYCYEIYHHYIFCIIARYHDNILQSCHFIHDTSFCLVLNIYEVLIKCFIGNLSYGGAPVVQWVKRWPTDLADRLRPPFEAKFSQPGSIAHRLSLSTSHRPDMTERLLKRM